MKTKMMALIAATLSSISLMSNADELSANANNNLNGSPNDNKGAATLTEKDTGMDKDANTSQAGNLYTQRDRDESQANTLQQLGEIRRADHVIGMKVTDQHGEKVGRVKDLILDLKNGRVVEVVLATGGFLGTDQKYIAVPPSLMQNDFSSTSLQVRADRAQLLSFERPSLADWDNPIDNRTVAQVYQNFGTQPYFTHGGEEIAGMNGNANQPVNRANAQANTHPVALNHLVRASKMMGAPAHNARDERLGVIQNFMVDLANGRVAEVIVLSDGAQGMGNQMTAIPPQSFHWLDGNAYPVLNATPDAIHTARVFNYNDFGSSQDASSISQVYSGYNIPPYFLSPDESNTAQNVREHTANAAPAMTAQDAGNNTWDVNTTADIRRALTSNLSLSTDAKNVKIIVVDGRVTLRGVVTSQEEKRTVEQAAANVVSADKVDNELQVIAPDGTSQAPLSNPVTPDNTMPLPVK